MQEKLKQFINVNVKNMLMKDAYKKSGSAYYKASGDLIYCINFQKSMGNRAQSARFYINIGIYSKQYQDVLQKEIKEQPNVTDWHVNKRIEQITGAPYTHYQIEDWAIPDLDKQISAELGNANVFFSGIDSTEKMMLYLLSLVGINYDLFRYILAKREYVLAERCFSEVKSKFDNEERWERIMLNYQKIADDFAFKLQT